MIECACLFIIGPIHLIIHSGVREKSYSVDFHATVCYLMRYKIFADDIILTFSFHFTRAFPRDCQNAHAYHHTPDYTQRGEEEKLVLIFMPLYLISSR